jgi:high-affinity Fe2+/Pb2+ permease
MIGVAFAVHATRNATLIELQAVMMGIFGSGLLGLFLLGFTTKSSNASAAIATGLTLAFVIAWLGLSQVESFRPWWPHELWLAVLANLMLFAIGSCGDRVYQFFQRGSVQSTSRESIE